MLDCSAYDSKSGNPFSDRPPTSRRDEEAQRALDSAVAELDSAAPDNFDSSVWERLCHYRKAKIEFEMNVSCQLGVTVIISGVSRVRLSHIKPFTADPVKALHFAILV